MPHELVVSTPVGDNVLSNQAYTSCIVSVERHELSIDLIVLAI